MKHQPITPNRILERAGRFIIREGKAAGQALALGDWFRLTREPGQVYRFGSHTRAPEGGEWIGAYGGTWGKTAQRSTRCFRATDKFIPCKAPIAAFDRKDPK